MITPLPQPFQDRWLACRSLERGGDRNRWLAAVQTFADELLSLPEWVWQGWAWSVAEENVDRRGGIPLAAPLFSRVVFPALLEGIDAGLPQCARWLAGLAQELYRCPDCMARLGPDRSNAVALLRIALAGDPDDQRSRQRLISGMAEQLAYALHEIPAGVLFGANGATPLQCALLREDLSEFEKLIEREGCARDHITLVERCRLHFAAYESYLRESPRLGDYAAFLARRVDA